MHDTVQSAEGEEEGEGGRGELAALMSHPFQKAAGSQKHFEKKKSLSAAFFLSSCFFFFFFTPILTCGSGSGSRRGTSVFISKKAHHSSVF